MCVFFRWKRAGERPVSRPVMKLSRTTISWDGSLLWAGTPALTLLLRWLTRSRSPSRPATAQTPAQGARPSKHHTCFRTHLNGSWMNPPEICLLLLYIVQNKHKIPSKFIYNGFCLTTFLLGFFFFFFRGNTKSSNHQSSSSSSSSSLSSCSSSSALAHELVQTTVTETDTSSQVDWTYDPNEPRYCICNQVCSHLSHVAYWF